MDDDDAVFDDCLQLQSFVLGDVIQMTMRPLPRGALRTRIEHLTSSVGFPNDRIFVLEGMMIWILL